MEKIKLIKLLEETNDVSLLDKYSDSEDNEIRFTVIMNQNISKDLLYKRFYLEENEKISRVLSEKIKKLRENYLDFIGVNLEDHIIRFYPKLSHVHGFDENCPTSWDHYYKEYLSFAIFYYDSEWDDKPEMVFQCLCDECSSLLSLNIITYFWLKDTKYKEQAMVTNITLADESKIEDAYDLYTIGYGTDWKIKREKRHIFTTEGEEEKENYFYELIPYLNYGPNKAYVLTLDEKELLSFNQILTIYLNECMKNSECI